MNDELKTFNDSIQGTYGTQSGPERKQEQAQTQMQSPGWRTYSVYVILFLYLYSFVTVFMCVTQYAYFAVAKSLYPNGTDKLNCTADENSQAYKESTKIQAETSVVNIYFSLAAGVPAILSNIVCGSLTDRFGRKFLLGLATLGTLAKTITVVIMMHYEISVYYYTVGFVLEGILGSFAGMFQAGFAYVADITTAGKNRSFGIALLEIVLGVSGVAGSFVTGFQINALGFMWTLVYAAGLQLLCIAIIIFVLPESVQQNDSKTIRNNIQYIKEVFKLYFTKTSDGLRWKYNVCIMAFMLTTLVNLGRPTVETVVQLGSPFCWSSEYIGYYGTIRYGLQAVFGIVLIKIIQKYLRDETICIIVSSLLMAALVVEGLANTDAFFYAVPVIGASGILAMPMLRAILSKMTPAEKQGAVFASIGAMETIGNLISSLIANGVYNQTVHIYRGIVFFMMAGFELVTIVLLLFPWYYNKTEYKRLES